MLYIILAILRFFKVSILVYFLPASYTSSSWNKYFEKLYNKLENVI